MKRHLLLLTFFFLMSCDHQSSQDETHNDLYLASIENNIITIEDFNNYLFSLPEDQRWPSKNEENWVKKNIRDLSVREQLISEGKLIGINQQSEFLTKFHDVKRAVYSDQFLKKHGNFEPIDEEKIKQYYEDNLHLFNLPEKRTVRHIYKQFNDDKDQALKDLSDIRTRIIKGENFKILAAKYSDSESRLNDGYVGVIEKGELSQDFDEIVFSLNKDTPSTLIETKEGVHIFMVENILAKKNFTFESVKAKIAQELNIVDGVNVTKQVAEKLPIANDFALINQKEFQELVSSFKNIEILKIGQFSLKKNQFVKNYEDVKNKLGVIHINNLPYIVFQEIAYRELIYQHMIANNIELSDDSKLETYSDQILIEIMGKHKMKSYLNHRPEIIENYYSQNSMRFATPVMVNLNILRIPILENKNIMPNLEMESIKLNNGKTDLKTLSKKYNGNIIQLQNKTAIQLQMINTKLLNLAFKVKKGEYSSPFTALNYYNILQVEDFIDAKEQTLIAVRDEIIGEYVNSNSADLFNKVTDELLSNLVYNEQAIEQYIIDHKRL